MRPSDHLIQGSPTARAAYNRGLEKAKQGAWDEAVAALEQALADDPRHLKARHVLGKVYLRQGYITRAQACWQNVLQIDPGNAAARQCLQALASSRTTAAAVDSSGLFRVVVLGLAIMALLLLNAIRQDARETRRTAFEQLRALENEVRALRQTRVPDRPPDAAAPAMSPVTHDPSVRSAEKGPLP